jgi:hypothetical protein
MTITNTGRVGVSLVLLAVVGPAHSASQIAAADETLKGA